MSTPADLDREQPRSFRRSTRASCARSMKPPRRCGRARRRQIVARRHRQHQALGLAILGDQRHPEPLPCLLRAADATGRPRCGFAGKAAQHAEQREQEFALALAVEPAEPDDFAGGSFQRNVLQAICPGKAPQLQPRRRVSLRGAGFAGKTCRYSRPIISSMTSSSLLAPARVGRDITPVAKDRTFVGDFGDLVHAMRDVEQREALRAQPLQHHEDLGDVGGRQRRGRLVENENARVARQSLGDLDHLAARQRQVFHQRAADGCRSRRPAPAPPRRFGAARAGRSGRSAAAGR